MARPKFYRSNGKRVTAEYVAHHQANCAIKLSKGDPYKKIKANVKLSIAVAGMGLEEYMKWSRAFRSTDNEETKNG